MLIYGGPKSQDSWRKAAAMTAICQEDTLEITVFDFEYAIAAVEVFVGTMPEGSERYMFACSLTFETETSAFEGSILLSEENLDALLEPI
jgi:hypothetical protein